jgi:hypothetical protein
MKVRDLINLLGEEDPDSEVLLVSWKDQSLWGDFSYNSQAQGVSQIPVNRVLLVPKGYEREH